MGVCIYFNGKLESEEHYLGLVMFSTNYALEHNWKVTNIETDGKVGIKLLVHQFCDPIFLRFGADWICQDYIKTQFAGVDCHIEVIKFFREIESFFKEFSVFDEGEYWDTGDRQILEEQFNTTAGLVEEWII